jgi:S-sulfo-L-cysteine synthase (3-phospho-L-serine-dependent)
MSPCVIFVESNTSGTGRLFARAAAQLGYQPVLLAAEPARYPDAAADGIETIRIDTSDRAALHDVSRRISAERGLAGVMTSSEYFVTSAAALARRLGLPGERPSVLRACRDKQKQRTILRAAGVGVPEFRGAASVKAAVKSAEALGLPVVVKPVSGSGSVGVRLCRSAEEVASHAEELLRQRVNERGLPVPRRILVESLVDGTEFSVEIFSGTVVGCTQKHLSRPPFFVEIGHDFPAALKPDEERVVRDAAVRALEELGLAWGPAHVELRLTRRGPVIIEVNPRLAGGFIPEIVRRATGVDLVMQTVRIAVGLDPQLEKLREWSASIRFLLSEREGVLRGAEGLDEVRARAAELDDVQLYAPPGGAVRLRRDFRDRLGHILTCRETPEETTSAVQSALAAIRLQVQPA